MGIQNLLPKLQSISTPLHVREYSGKKAAVDTYSWMHKAAFNCSKEICEGRPASTFIDYCMRRVNLLRHCGVEPLLVFDGGSLPMKADQEAKRSRSRKQNLERALEHERNGNYGAADLCYKKAVDITPSLAFALIKVLRQNNVQYIVAPYEADAQLAYLALNEHVHVVITEDSDMVAYGCPRVLFKMDKDGQGIEFQYCDLVRNKDLDFTNFTRQMVLEMCIMSGCDYLSSLPGLGVKRAHGLIKRMKTYKKVISHMRLTGVQVPHNYEEQFGKAILTFNHQRVFDPVAGEIVHLREVPKDVVLDLDFVGPFISATLARSIARGDVDPDSKQPFKQEGNTGFQMLPKGRVEHLQQKNLLTNYFSREKMSLDDQLKNLPPLPSDESDGTVSPPLSPPVPNRSPTAQSVSFADELDLGEPYVESYSCMDQFRRAEQGALEPAVQIPSSRPSSTLVAYGVSRAQSSGSSCQSDGDFGFNETRLDLKALPVKRSAYFSRNAAQYIDSEDVLPEDDHNWENRMDKEQNLRQQLQEPKQAPKVQKRNAKTQDTLAAIKRKHIPVFSSALLGDDTSRRTFSTDVSHVEHFASLAEQSIERFVSTITPFRRSAAGARPSGLRPLGTSIHKVPRTRENDASLANHDFSVFAHAPASFKPPRTVGLQQQQRVVIAGAARRGNADCS